MLHEHVISSSGKQALGRAGRLDHVAPGPSFPGDLVSPSPNAGTGLMVPIVGRHVLPTDPWLDVNGPSVPRIDYRDRLGRMSRQRRRLWPVGRKAGWRTRTVLLAVSLMQHYQKISAPRTQRRDEPCR